MNLGHELSTKSLIYPLQTSSYSFFPFHLIHFSRFCLGKSFNTKLGIQLHLYRYLLCQKRPKLSRHQLFFPATPSLFSFRFFLHSLFVVYAVRLWLSRLCSGGWRWFYDSNKHLLKLTKVTTGFPDCQSEVSGLWCYWFCHCCIRRW